MNAPPKGLTLPCRILACHDGDSLTAEIAVTAQVRLLDNWAPELKEKGGPESRDNLIRAAVGQKGVIHIPADDAKNIADLLTFGRVLAHIWIEGKKESLSEMQVRTKNAATKKGRPLGQ